MRAFRLLTVAVLATREEKGVLNMDFRSKLGQVLRELQRASSNGQEVDIETTLSTISTHMG